MLSQKQWHTPPKTNTHTTIRHNANKNIRKRVINSKMSKSTKTNTLPNSAVTNI
jgi:hypothetical protein